VSSRGRRLETRADGYGGKHYRVDMKKTYQYKHLFGNKYLRIAEGPKSTPEVVFLQKDGSFLAYDELQRQPFITDKNGPENRKTEVHHGRKRNN
jgi:hypothetical protein